MTKIIFSFITIIFISGCTITPSYEEIPKTEKEFKLSQDEILEKFPAITHHHRENLGDSNKTIPAYEDIVADWGEPVSTKKEWLQYFWQKANFGAIGYVTIGRLDTTWLLFEGAMIAVSPFPPETYTWHKEDYIINATFNSSITKDEKRFVSWKWKRKQGNNLINILPPKPDKKFYFKMGYSSGGEKIFNLQNSTLKRSIGFGTTLQLAYDYKLSSTTSDKLKFAGGIKYSGIVIPQSGAKLVEYPIDAVLSIKTPKFPLHVGVGIGYKVNPIIDNFSDDIDKLKLDDAVSFILELESKDFSIFDSTIRYEFLNYTKDGMKDIRGNNFSIYINNYF